jgi:hypothetical protein
MPPGNPPNTDVSCQAAKFTNRTAHPFEEGSTGRNERDEQSRIDVGGILACVMAVDIGHDGAVPIDASAKEMVKQLCGD